MGIGDEFNLFISAYAAGLLTRYCRSTERLIKGLEELRTIPVAGEVFEVAKDSISKGLDMLGESKNMFTRREQRFTAESKRREIPDPVIGMVRLAGRTLGGLPPNTSADQMDEKFKGLASSLARARGA
ncbi:MAG: hypothetical protein G01um101416_486 [Microgenomates group bacterium Gr01-1014_16]|nr:MAG: hypothetical protein G01um101416_486 [Microgenomates group bacterium Gr01-1014_16]